MTITLDVPEDFAVQLGGSSLDLSRKALEALVLEAYRSEKISSPSGAAILGMPRLQWEQFLDYHGVLEGAYTVEDLERDVETLRGLRAAGQFRPVSFSSPPIHRPPAI